METFTDPKQLTELPRFQEQRRKHLARLKLGTIDAPIREVVRDFARLPYCFTLQSCYGHFLHRSEADPHNTEPIPALDSTALVEYRIAYIALCIENSSSGRALFDDLRDVQSIDPEYVQFGSGEWFWERQPNSYALQVEPRRHMKRDKVIIGYEESLHIEKLRERFFAQLGCLVQGRLPSSRIGLLRP